MLIYIFNKYRSNILHMMMEEIMGVEIMMVICNKQDFFV